MSQTHFHNKRWDPLRAAANIIAKIEVNYLGIRFLIGRRGETQVSKAAAANQSQGRREAKVEPPDHSFPWENGAALIVVVPPMMREAPGHSLAPWNSSRLYLCHHTHAAPPESSCRWPRRKERAIIHSPLNTSALQTQTYNIHILCGVYSLGARTIRFSPFVVLRAWHIWEKEVCAVIIGHGESN